MSGETCCCFCLNLRSGSYLSATFSLVMGVLGLISSILAGINGRAEGVMYFVVAATYVFWIIFSIVLIVGVRKSSRGYLIPWVVMTVVIGVFMLLTIIMLLVHHESTFGSGGAIFNLIVSVVIFGLSIYALYCVISLYRKNMNP